MGFLSGLFSAAAPIVGGLIGGPTGSLIGGAIGSGIDSFSADQRQSDFNQFSSAQSQAQMAFQERMSSTAHQREVKDLRKAGLNPILSARYGGSSTPAGAQPAHLEKPSATINAATAQRTIRLQEQKLKSEIQLIDANTQATMAKGDLTGRQQDRITHEIGYLVNQAHQALEAGNLSARRSEIAHVEAQIKELDLTTAKLMLQQLQMEMKVYKGKFGQHYKEQEIASRGNIAKSITSKAGKNFLDGIKFIIELLEDKLK